MTLPGGEGLGFELAGARPVLPEVSGETAIYRNILPNTDIELMAGAANLKETIVLRSPDAPTTWEFPLQLDGLTPYLEDDGSISLTDSDGTTVAWIPKGFMQDSAPVDASGEPPTSDDVFYELASVDGRTVLRVTVDEAWLNDPARVWPIKVDPTLVRV